MKDLCCQMTVRSQLGDYPVEIHNSPEFLSGLALLPETALLIDRKVYELHRATLQNHFNDTKFFPIDADEESKTLRGAEKIYEWLIGNFTAKRNLNLISIGGGVIQDVSGFAASTLFRGIGWYFVPTTLLAQCDSCIGGKTSLNFGRHKNLLGTFFPPKKVLIWPGFTETLSGLDRAGGYGEIIKFLLMEGFEKHDLSAVEERMNRIVTTPEILPEAIRDCLNIKRSFMEEDEFDRGRRNLLNYGHCFGHALEAASEFYVPHGIAVNVGILFANLGAVERGTLTEAECLRIARRVNLPYLFQPQRICDYNPERLLENLKNDKKRTGSGLPLVIPGGDGLIRLDDFTEEEFAAVLRKLKELLFPNHKGMKQ